MKEKKKSAVSWILTWAGQKRIAYVWSVLLAIGNVIFKILPYFIIADVVKLFLNISRKEQERRIRLHYRLSLQNCFIHFRQHCHIKQRLRYLQI